MKDVIDTSEKGVLCSVAFFWTGVHLPSGKRWLIRQSGRAFFMLCEFSFCCLAGCGGLGHFQDY